MGGHRRGEAEWAIENSKEWYTPAEYAEVRRLMDADLADTRKQLDDQLKPIDDGWTKYSTGKDSLRLLLPIKLQMVLICSLTSVISGCNRFSTCFCPDCNWWHV